MDSPRPAYALVPNASVEAELRRLAREQLDAALSHLAGAAQDTDPAGPVHEARKTMKSLRALLRLVLGALDGPCFEREDVTFRDVARLLASAREHTAARVALDRLAARAATIGPDTATWGRARMQLDAVTDGRGADRPTAAALEAATAALVAAHERVEAWSLDRDGWSALRGGLRRTYARGRSGFAAARRHPTVSRLHEWRKWVKHHQYQLRLLRHGWTAALRVRRDALDELGELLGDDHDLALLSELLRPDGARAAVAGGELEAILVALEARRTELQRTAFQLGARLYVERPRHLVRRLAAYVDVGDAGATSSDDAGETDPTPTGAAGHSGADAGGTKLA